MSKIDSRLFSFEKFFAEEPLDLEVGKIYQIGELSVVRDGEIPEHTQFCDELTYAVSGRAKIFSDGESFDISGGDIHFIKKGFNHKIIADKDENFRYICIGFNPNKQNESVMQILNEIKDRKHIIVKSDNNMRTLCELLIDEIYTNDNQSNNMINLLMLQILISFSRLIKGKRKRMPIEKTGSGYAIYHTLRYIDREYINIKSVKSISEELSYSEYYLSHLFKQKVGVSIKEYIIEKKLKYAAVLLKSSDLSISEIAEYLNFSTLHTFSQAFKRYFNMSSTEYKKIDSKFQTV